MPMKVEAAIVTQKRAEASFNTDSVNVNGKVFPRDVIKNGYKGSGIISGSVYFALTSSVVDGFADAAVAAFNERAQVFNVAKDARTVFSGFYEDCRNALLNMGRKENELTCAGFFAKDRKVVLSGNEGVKLYLSRLGNCTPVTPEKAVDTTADYSSCVFADVTPGDIFILLSPGSAEVLSEKEIEDICRISDGSVKRIVSYITKVGLAKEGGNAVSAIVVKILETAAEEELRTPAFVPDFGAIEEKEEKRESAAEEQAQTPVSEDVVSAETEEQLKEELSENIPETEAEAVTEAVAEEAEEKEEASEAEAEPVVPAVAESTDEATEEEVSEELSEEEKKAKAEERTRKILFSILGVLVAISIALIGVIIAYSGIFSGEETTTAADETTIVEETTEEETTDEETTGEEATEESTSEEAATEAEATTNKPQNTVVPVTPAVTTTEQSVETTAPAVETTEEEEITSEEAPSEPVESTTENTEAETDAPAEEEPATEAAPSEEAPSEETPAENTEENTAAE
ncbi:MAG: hypothetical protein IKB08_09410 [Clostridia bacterium]|nr:hypothetical protein [Clostridia bacterium]